MIAGILSRLTIYQYSQKNMEKPLSNPVIITTNTALSWTRLKNFYLTHVLQGFVWMVFHFSVVYFFTFQLWSLALVGIFLWIANLIAFFVDIPVGILQRYYTTKRLFTIAAIGQLIATWIFFLFIYNVFSTIGAVWGAIVPDGFESVIGWFFSNIFNWILLLIASICYGIVKEINDVSTYGYILSHANPSDYATILARNNITYWIGSLIWLLTSGIILSINPTFAVIVLWLLIGCLLWFIVRFFDNNHDSIWVNDIVSFTVAVKTVNKENVTEYITQKIQAVDLPKIMQSTKYIFLKPKNIKDTWFEWGSLWGETKISAKVILNVLTAKPIHLILYWTIFMVLIFGFWDTFATTFLIEFLDSTARGWWYAILALIAIPAYWLQEPAAKLSEKIGFKIVAYFWLLVSWASVILMWIFIDGPIIMILILAIINSIGYACGMSLGQREFLESYNQIYAEQMALTEIDANASAWPIKIIQNLANVVGLMIWWFVLEVFWYTGFFTLFWSIILLVLGWSIKHRWDIRI